jgi:hypothetical protein
MPEAQADPFGVSANTTAHDNALLGSVGQLIRDTGRQKPAEVPERMIPITWFIGAFIFLFGIAFALERVYAERQGRLGQLICKHNDYGIAQRVFRREIWQGQSDAQLLDSRGEPVEINGLSAPPERQEWIYSGRGLGRGRLRVTLENGVVTTWGSTTMTPVGEETGSMLPS